MNLKLYLLDKSTQFVYYNKYWMGPSLDQMKTVGYIRSQYIHWISIINGITTKLWALKSGQVNHPAQTYLYSVYPHISGRGYQLLLIMTSVLAQLVERSLHIWKILGTIGRHSRLRFSSVIPGKCRDCIFSLEPSRLLLVSFPLPHPGLSYRGFKARNKFRFL